MAETPDRHTRRTRHRVAKLGNAPNLAGMEQKQERMTTSGLDTSARERTHEQGRQTNASRSPDA